MNQLTMGQGKFVLGFDIDRFYTFYMTILQTNKWQLILLIVYTKLYISSEKYFGKTIILLPLTFL